MPEGAGVLTVYLGFSVLPGPTPARRAPILKGKGQLAFRTGSTLSTAAWQSEHLPTTVSSPALLERGNALGVPGSGLGAEAGGRGGGGEVPEVPKGLLPHRGGGGGRAAESRWEHLCGSGAGGRGPAQTPAKAGGMSDSCSWGLGEEPERLAGRRHPSEERSGSFGSDEPSLLSELPSSRHRWDHHHAPLLGGWPGSPPSSLPPASGKTSWSLERLLQPVVAALCRGGARLPPGRRGTGRPKIKGPRGHVEMGCRPDRGPASSLRAVAGSPPGCWGGTGRQHSGAQSWAETGVWGRKKLFPSEGKGGAAPGGGLSLGRGSGQGEQKGMAGRPWGGGGQRSLTASQHGPLSPGLPAGHQPRLPARRPGVPVHGALCPQRRPGRHGAAGADRPPLLEPSAGPDW